MVDPYAIVRRLTGYELISPKDARLLTEAVDGLIGEIGSKDARIAELTAENERLISALDRAADRMHKAEALSRTGAVKPLEWTKVTAARSDEDPNREHTGDYEAETPFGTYYIEQYFGSDSYVYEVTFNGYDKIGDHDDPSDAKAAAQADYERRITSALTAGKPEPETVESVLLDAVRKIASTDLSGCADMTTAEIFGALSRMHETARVAVETAERILEKDEER